jgi:hypothetical protein
MNVRRGVTRLFLIAWVTWLGFGIYAGIVGLRPVLRTLRAQELRTLFNRSPEESWYAYLKPYRHGASEDSLWRSARRMAKAIPQPFWSQLEGNWVPSNAPRKIVDRLAVIHLLIPAGIFFAVRWAVSGFEDKRSKAPPTA